VTSGPVKRRRGGSTKGVCCGGRRLVSANIEMVRRQGGTIRLGSTRLPSYGSEPRERPLLQHVQAITVAIDQYAEKALATVTTFSTSPTARLALPRPAGGISYSTEPNSDFR